MLRDIYLHGRLGERHGHHVRLDVDSPMEAVRALCMTRPGFREDMREGYYKITRGSDPLTMDELGLRMGRCRDLHIIPQPVVAGIEIGMIGWLLVGAAVVAVAALAFMPTIKPPDAKDRENNKTNFLFDGPVNVTEQGHPVPLVFGTWRTGSVVVSSAVETTDIPASMIPAVSTDGFGDNNDPSLEARNRLILHWLVLGKGGKGGGKARAAQEDPNTLQSQATARVIDLISEGEIVGLVDGLKSVYFDDTPVQNEDGTFNFKGVAIEERVGLPTQDYMPGHSDQSNAREISRPITTAIGPVVETITDADINRARVTLGLNSLFYQDPNNGDMKRTFVDVKIELQSNGGGYTTVKQHRFDGKTTSKYQKSFDIDLPAGGNPWDIRVSRVTPDRPSANYQDEVTWDILTEITDAKLTYPDSAVIGLTVDAKQFGSKIPTRSYLVKGLIVDVPTNFDPDTREYATTGPGTSGGTWDGTFKRAWTDEPVWCFRELCLNPRWGLGRRVGVDNIDKWTLYVIAQRNNGSVPDGLGGTEPRHTFNAAITSREQAYNVLQSMAATFRSVVYWYNGMISLGQDAPADPSQLVVPANVFDGEINYETPDVEDKASAYIVAYNDPEDSYRLAFEVVEDQDLRQLIGWKAKEVTAYGETRRSGAIRYGRWLLEDQRLDERASWAAGFDQAQMLPQEVVAIQDPEVAGKQWGGRLLSATTTTAELDRSVTLEAGQTYTLKMMQRDGTVAERVVLEGPGATSSLSWASALSDAPLAGAIWALESDQLVQTQWRVETREEIEGEDLRYAIRAAQHDPDKYDRVELGLKIEPRPTSSLPSGALEVPSGLAFTEFVKLEGDVGVPAILFSWSPATDIRVTGAQCQVKRPESETYEPVEWRSGVGVEIYNITEGEHTLLVRFTDDLGRVGGWSALTATFDGLPPAPEKPSGFYAYPGVDGVRFIWNAVTTHGSVLDYEIRVGETWEAGQYICRVESDTITVKLPTSLALNKMFWLAARVKGTDIYSDAIFTTTYQANIPNVNIVLTEDFQADSFAGGMLRRLEIENLDGEDALKLSVDPSTSTRYPWGDYRDSVDLGDVFYARCWLETKARNVTDEVGPTWDDLDTPWDSLGDLTWSPADGPLSDVSISAFIAVDTPPDTVLEAWPLGVSNDGVIVPTAATEDILTDPATGVSLHGYGVEIGTSSLLGWEANVPFTEAFTLSLNYTPDAIPAEDRVLVTVTDGTDYLQLLYDNLADKLVLTDGTNELECEPPAWSDTETYRIAITQTASEWRIAWVANDAADAGAFASAAHAPAATFDTIYLGSAGPGAQETWEDAGYTWEDIEAQRTWEELGIVLFPAPGFYADMILSTIELSEDDYALTLLLRGPAGYSDYKPLIPGDYNFQRAWVWQRLAAPIGVGQNIYLTESALHVDVPDILDGGEAAVGAMETVINFNQAFHAAPKVQAVVIGASSPAIVDIVSKSATSFSVKLRDAASPSTLVAGDIDWAARGY